MKRSTVRERLLASTMIGGATLVALSAAPAFAADEPASTTVQEVVVTGSRIPHPNLTSVSPLTTVNDQDIKLQGTQNIEDMINSLPQAFADFGAMESNGATGTATIDLRGLGSKRSLVLIDGKRMQPGDPGLPVPDINMIPTALVDRIDIVTGGASAVYGSDAIAGVVNFIMKKDFEGIRIDAQYGIDQHNQHNGHIRQAVSNSANYVGNIIDLPTGSIWDGKRESVTIVAGANAADGRANVTAYFNYQHTDPVLEKSRDFTACSLSTNNTATSFQYCGGSSTSYPGRFKSSVTGLNWTIDGNGTVHPFTNAALYNFAPLNYLQRPDERYTAGEFSHYQVNEHLDVYSSFMFMHDDSKAQIAGSGAFFGSAFNINCSNPLMTASEATAFCGANAGNNVLVPLGLGRRDVEGPGRVSWLQHWSYRYVLGAKGEITDGWNYDVYAQYGHTALEEEEQGYFLNSHINEALNAISDGAGGAICANPAAVKAGCVPWNIWNNPAHPGGVTAAQLAYLEGSAMSHGSTTEQIVSGNINGDLGKYGLKLPWAKDGVGVSLGAEYRREALDVEFDTAFRSGDLGGLGGAPQNTQGAFDVKEIFGEIRVPIVQDAAFAKELSFEGGFRHSDYSSAGGVNSYKAALDWQIIPDIRLRGSYQRAVRAPNVNELFSPNAPGLWAGTDPCASNHTGTTLAECQNTGLTSLQYTNHVSQCVSSQCNGVFSGNPFLKPETSDTKSFGAVFTPTFLPGFSMTVDWFDITVKDVIQTLPGAIALGTCMQDASATLVVQGVTQTYCSLIHRDPGGVTAGSLFGNGFVFLPTINAGQLHTSGIDIQADYRVRLSDWGLGDSGSLTFNLVGTKLDKLVTVEPGVGGTYDCAGLFGTTCGTPSPTWRHKLRVSWISPWNFTVSAQWRYIAGASLDFNTSNPVLQNGFFDTSDAKAPAMSYFDLSGQWKIKDGLTLRAGVNNIFDKDPPIFDSNSFGISAPAFGNGNTYPQLYDSLGRTMFVSITADF